MNVVANQGASLQAWHPVKRGEPTPLDVYDAAAWSVIGPLSEQSIAMGSHPVAFPDFTGGLWAKRKPIFALGDEY